MMVLAQITMNAGNNIPGSVIKWHLKKYANKFDKVLIVDGKLTEDAKIFYQQFSNLEVVDSPWKDSYVEQYRAFSDRLNENDWCLYLDCDEIISENLMNFILDKNNFNKECNMYWLPCVLHLTEDDKKYYPSELDPKVNFEGQWTKHILFRKDKNLTFRYFGSHVIPTHGNEERALYVPFPYFHMKSFESFVYNDIWQAFLHPEGQGYYGTEAARFRMLTKCYSNTQEFKNATFNKNWSPALQKFAWDNRLEIKRPISRLAWVYFILQENKYLEYDEKMNWNFVKNFILNEESNLLFVENKKKENYIEC